LENVQMNKKREKGEFTGCQVSSNWMWGDILACLYRHPNTPIAKRNNLSVRCP
jgi:hypothetical protein